jgi:hypothetical protein
MPVLKFTYDGEIKLDKYKVVDITEDKRTALIDKQSFYNMKFKVEKDVYLAMNDMFFTLSKMFNNDIIDAMLLRDGDKKILIVPSRSYVFWNGKSVDPAEYTISQSIGDILKLLR